MACPREGGRTPCSPCAQSGPVQALGSEWSGGAKQALRPPEAPNSSVEAFKATFLRAGPDPAHTQHGAGDTQGHTHTSRGSTAPPPALAPPGSDTSPLHPLTRTCTSGPER